MNFTELSFIPFFLITFLLYYTISKKYRYLIILVASYIFYGFSNPNLVITLAIVTLLTYLGGLILDKKKSAKLFSLFFLLNIGILFTLKYTNFSLEWFNYFLLKFGYTLPSQVSNFNLVAPIGLSFYIFRSTTYLSDIYRKNMKAEHNLFRYATFVSFFPVLLSGPIQKSRDLLPQLKKPANFSSELCIKGFMLFIWGFFEKIVVANNLKYIIDIYWNNMTTYTGIYPLIAAIAFSLYIYSDFSSYSDMACGISKMLGFNIKNNFKNPYLATSLAKFWNQWHITLNEWFIENVYIPLGGKRKGKLRKYINVMLVFLFSGAWHGAEMHYIIWGLLNGILQILGQIISPIKQKLYKIMKINEDCFSIRNLKRIGVFIIITITWIFFRAPGTHAALEVLNSIFSIRIIDFFNQDIINISGTPMKTLFCLIAIVIFCIIQYHRKEANKYYRSFRSQPLFFQTLFIGIVIFIIIMVSTSNSISVNNDFIYFQF